MWYFIDTGQNNAAWNMAFDEAVIKTVESDNSLSVVRVYGWTPWAISIGYSQNAEKDFNLNKIKQSGYEFVRRTTGGRAVLHANEITYSVIAGINNPQLGNNLHNAYRSIGSAILKSLQYAGFNDLLLEKSKASDSSTRNTVAKPCFSSTARYEIIWKGKKVVGSAQKRTRTTIQQHGAILLGDEYLNITDFMNLNEEQKKQHKNDLYRNAVSLSAFTGKKVSYNRISEVFIKGFEEYFGQKVLPFVIADDLNNLVRELSEKKYSTNKWNIERKSVV